MNPPLPPPPPTPLDADKDTSSCGSDPRPSDSDNAELETGRLETNRTTQPAWHRASESFHESETQAAAEGTEDGYLFTRQSTTQSAVTSSSKAPNHEESRKMEKRAAAASESHCLSKAQRNAVHLARKRRNAARSREYKKQRMSDLKVKVEHFEQLVQSLVSEQAVLKAQIDVLKTTFGSAGRPLPAPSQPSNLSSTRSPAIGSARSESQTTPRNSVASDVGGDVTAPLNVLPPGWNPFHGSVHPPYTGYSIPPQALGFPIIQGSTWTSIPFGTPTVFQNTSNGGQMLPMQGNASQGTPAFSPAAGATNTPATAPETQVVQDLIRVALMARFRPS